VTWSELAGVVVVKAGPDEVILELEVKDHHLQTAGLVHGGVHCTLIESAASLGATLVARARGQAPPVGLEHSTSFVKAASTGTIRATARPVTSGRTTQLWEVTVKHDQDVLATGRVRLLCK
jgi:uncharacterized protein (TIGR00369 family)